MSTTEIEAVVHHRTRMQEAAPVLGGAAMLASFAACLYFARPVLAGTFAHHLASGFLLPTLVGAAFLPLALYAGLSVMATSARGHVDARGVFVGRRRIVDFERCEAAYYEPRADGSGLVCFVGRAGRLLGAVVSDRENATRILEMAGADEKIASVPPAARGRLRKMVTFVPLLMGFLNQHIGLTWLFSAFSVLMAIGLVVMRRRWVTIDDENFVVHRALGKVSVPIRSIRRSASLDAHGLRIEHEAGVLDIDGGNEMELAHGRLVLRRDALIERIGAAQEELRARERAVVLAEPLARGTRDVESWLRDLAAVASGGAYRGRSFREDDLWAILEEPAVSEDARAAAALLLRQSAMTAESSVPARIRVVATETESPRLRVAIEEILEGDEGDERREAFAALAASR